MSARALRGVGFLLGVIGVVVVAWMVQKGLRSGADWIFMFGMPSLFVGIIGQAWMIQTNPLHWQPGLLNLIWVPAFFTGAATWIFLPRTARSAAVIGVVAVLLAHLALFAVLAGGFFHIFHHAGVKLDQDEGVKMVSTEILIWFVGLIPIQAWCGFRVGRLFYFIASKLRPEPGFRSSL